MPKIITGKPKSSGKLATFLKQQISQDEPEEEVSEEGSPQIDFEKGTNLELKQEYLQLENQLKQLKDSQSRRTSVVMQVPSRGRNSRVV